MINALRKISHQLRPVDLHFGDLVARMGGRDGEGDEAVALGAALASHVVGGGHVCLDLREWAGQRFPLDEGDESRRVDLPPLSAWREAARAASNRIGEAGAATPLIIDAADRLYLRRYWRYQQNVVDTLKAMATPFADVVYPPDFGRRLTELLSAEPDKGGDHQRLAAFSALRNRLSVISGGPGTGKTYTILRVLVLLIETRGDDDKPLRIKLAAPTGKASNRMVESVRDGLKEMKGRVQEKIPREAATLHRLLGYIPNSPYFKHGRNHPLDADIVVVDEASMIDLPMMSKLLDALGPETRLVLLGDMDQLASVDPGYVFGDICAAMKPGTYSRRFISEYEAATSSRLTSRDLRPKASPGLGDCLVKLIHSRRFPATGAIGSVSAGINAGCPERAWTTLTSVANQESDDATSLLWRDSTQLATLRNQRGLALKELRETIIDGYRDFLNADSPEEAFDALKRFRVLCPTRRGPYGERELNRIAEEVLSFRNVKGDGEEFGVRRPLKPDGEFYDHRLIMITRNDSGLMLFNGTIGVILDRAEAERKRTSASGPMAFFEEMDETGKQTCRGLPVSLLPDHETAFATTIHKSQGSEFDKVLVPIASRQSSSLTRELLYTAITRCRTEAELWCSEARFKDAVKTATRRSSGLRDALVEKRDNQSAV